MRGDLGQLTAVSRLQGTLHLNLVSSQSLPDAGAHSLDAVARAINAAGITPPEGRAWYKTTVEAYLRHEGDERLRVLGTVAPSRFARPPKI